ncbi:MAG: zinc-binding alcohol dehydrogenase family protein [Zymomonas mobilis]|uniref:Zinc-type alcohol dehydrogenase-like protein n=1 Tax=Zymomonas mobilis subsp. mobilis (strain ATCC 10988 / DSM 424 / LMG 404 / NCIMB 8938 / NRRL B-806 / ZM1) TaxID=555217 RepID=A0A0H3G3C0_ZYMMA|nr:zinc-binding alcohol dehydrogenase family protein [Zymomonas mobilis]ACV76061.1 zinc-binding alcohol dehydrogenase family protein [Zymomonas mobilis subsp. mobilis NCIMB 11163]AEH63263.1 zinc-binding alcohol dehydrogenase family protein [Zymomonas mobilis subsp. mobilis ATCC 10988]TQL27122.1 zinc-binding alcohol dehydrogenase family protein [Zymomonas mobilis]TQL28552.1 zinc-binding alcohol dehydrogenase family protein [Zymomonas mobilis]
MRAIGYQKPLPITETAALVDIDIPKPKPKGRDLLVEIKAVSVNPVDTKVRQKMPPKTGEEWKILGWDAAGVVVETGRDAELFKVGDEVFYAGAFDRSGSNAEFQLVDEQLVGQKPKSLNWAEAAALPLTTLTAWEVLFDRLNINMPVAGMKPVILIIGGGGGVSSIAIQLARQLSNATVIATASRPESREWVTEMGAHYVIDHSKPLPAQIEALHLDAPSFVFSTTHTAQHFAESAELMAPQGRFALIDEPGNIDIALFQAKSLSLHYEFMFTRSMFKTADLSEQHRILNRVSRLVDEGRIRTTLAKNGGVINAAHLKQAHQFIEDGHARGKIVLEGF